MLAPSPLVRSAVAGRRHDPPAPLGQGGIGAAASPGRRRIGARRRRRVGERVGPRRLRRDGDAPRVLDGALPGVPWLVDLGRNGGRGQGGAGPGGSL